MRLAYPGVFCMAAPTTLTLGEVVGPDDVVRPNRVGDRADDFQGAVGIVSAHGEGEVGGIPDGGVLDDDVHV